MHPRLPTRQVIRFLFRCCLCVASLQGFNSSATEQDLLGTLEKSWKEILASIDTVRKEMQVPDWPVIFTELGYTSWQGSTGMLNMIQVGGYHHLCIWPQTCLKLPQLEIFDVCISMLRCDGTVILEALQILLLKVSCGVCVLCARVPATLCWMGSSKTMVIKLSCPTSFPIVTVPYCLSLHNIPYLAHVHLLPRSLKQVVPCCSFVKLTHPHCYVRICLFDLLLVCYIQHAVPHTQLTENKSYWCMLCAGWAADSQRC